MKLWKLSVDIDGFGGKEKDKYFFTKTAAIKNLESHSGVWHHLNEQKNEMVWDIEGMKETRYSESNDLHLTHEKTNEIITIIGVSYPEKERDEYSVRWAEICIEEFDVPNHPFKDRIYVLCKKAGYQEYVDAAFRPEQQGIENPAHKAENRRDELLVTFSKNYARKTARSHYKETPRMWVNKEYEEEISVMGYGQDYLIIEEYRIKHDGLDDLTSENVETVFKYCLANLPDGHNGEMNHDIIITEAIMSKIMFSKRRLEEMKSHISTMLSHLPSEFKQSGGGGYTFLNACEDENHHQWTGMQTIMDHLFALGISIGKCNYLLPREVWGALPGGMPYIIVFDDFKEVMGTPGVKAILIKLKEERRKKIEKEKQEKG